MQEAVTLEWNSEYKCSHFEWPSRRGWPRGLGHRHQNQAVSRAAGAALTTRREAVLKSERRGGGGERWARTPGALKA